MKDYVKGIIGGLIGGIIAALPWILMYVYGGYILSILAAIIAMGVKIGYTKLNGKIDKKFPYIISSISILIVAISTLVVIPLLLLQQEGFLANFSNLSILYQDSEFLGRIMTDFIISIIFALLGISGVIRATKAEVGIEVKKSQSSLVMQERISYMKSKFEKKNALSKEQSVTKEEIIDNDQDKKIFNSLRLQQIISKNKGKYYWSIKAENSVLYRFVLLYFKILLILILIVIIIFILMMFI